MAKFDLEDERDYWISLIYFVSDRQVATAHLFFSLLTQKLLKGVRKEKQNPYLLLYLDKALAYLKDVVKPEEPVDTPYDQNIASFSLAEVFDILWETKPVGIILNKPVYFQAVKKIVDRYHEVIGEKSFKEYFDDITFNERGRVSSEKAEALVKEYMEKVQAGEFGDMDEDDEDLSWPPALYNRKWEEHRELLGEMTVESALLFHAATLLLCRKCEVDSKVYAKYEKAVVKAITTYTGNFNQHQKDFALDNADDVYEKLKERILQSIEREYDNGSVDESDEVNKNENFTIASDLSLIFVSNAKDDKVDEMLDTISVNKGELIVGDNVKEFCDEICKNADAILDEILEDFYADDEDDEDYEYGEYDDDQDKDQKTESNEDATSEDENPVEKKDPKQVREDFQKHIIDLLEKFDLDQDIFFHVVYLDILTYKEIQYNIYSKYHDAVNEAVKTYKSDKDGSFKEMAREKVDKVFLEMYFGIMDMMDGPEVDADEASDNQMQLLFVSNALVICLEDIPKIYKGSIEKSLKELEFDTMRDDYYSIGTEAYSLKYRAITGNGLLYDFIQSVKEAGKEDEYLM